MPSRSIRFVVVLVVLVIGLLPGVAAAEPHARVPRSHSVFELTLGFVTQIWAKIGCELDPSGLCIPSPGGQSTQDGEIGCGIDPDGHCIQSLKAQVTPPNPGEIGCTIDPDGRCLQASRAQGTDAQGEIGCELDPNGRCGR